EILGLARDASADEIKRAFRRIARACHPDLAGGDPEREERFKAARSAYETLSDPTRRRQYDRRNERRAPAGSFTEAFQRHVRPSARPPAARPDPDRGAPSRGNDVGLDDLFGDFGFGGAAERGPGSGRPEPRASGRFDTGPSTWRAVGSEVG